MVAFSGKLFTNNVIYEQFSLTHRTIIVTFVGEIRKKFQLNKKQ
jgi:hypothetical protein